METLLAQLPGDPASNAAIIGVASLAILDFILGSSRALAQGTFTLDSFSTWVRAQIAGHVLPIIFVLAFGQVVGDIQIGPVAFNILTATGLAGAASYAATTVKSIVDTLNPQASDPVPPPAT
jgi:hypothetical protein